MVQRNDPCPCQSGKKYKQCCLGKKHSADVAVSSQPELPTWKIFLVALVVIILIGGALWLADLPRVAQVLSATLFILAIIWAAFRRPPPPRTTTGDAGSINFGR